MTKPWTLSWHKDRLADDLRQADFIDTQLRAYAPCFTTDYLLCGDCCDKHDLRAAERLLSAKRMFINNASYHKLMIDKLIEKRGQALVQRESRVRRPTR